MMLIQTWGDVFTQSLQNLWYGVAHFVPGLILALIIFAIGWVLAALVERLIEALIRSIKLDSALRSAGLEDVIKRAGHTLNSGWFLGVLCKWFVIVVFLMAAFNVLGLSQVNDFLDQVVNYLPHVIVAVLIFFVAAVVANAMQKLAVASAKAAHLHVADLVGRVTKWSIWIFAFVWGLDVLGVNGSIIQTVLTAVFAGAALAFGLAFGLGGKDLAARILDRTSHALNLRD